MAFSFSIEEFSTNETFEHQFDNLCDFVAQHGHANVPYPYASNPQLSLWVRSIRREYQRMLRSNDNNNSENNENDMQRKRGRPKDTRNEIRLTPERMQALLSIGYRL